MDLGDLYLLYRPVSAARTSTGPWTSSGCSSCPTRADGNSTDESSWGASAFRSHVLLATTGSGVSRLGRQRQEPGATRSSARTGLSNHRQADLPAELHERCRGRRSPEPVAVGAQCRALHRWHGRGRVPPGNELGRTARLRRRLTVALGSPGVELDDQPRAHLPPADPGHTRDSTAPAKMVATRRTRHVALVMPRASPGSQPRQPMLR